MNYVITIYKRPGVQPHARDPLYAIWIDAPEAETQPGTVWVAAQTLEITTEEPIPVPLCGLLLISEATSDRLFRQIADTWLGSVEDDSMNDYDWYASREDSKTVLNKNYVDRLEGT